MNKSKLDLPSPEMSDLKALREHFPVELLQPGDCILYRPKDVFDALVALKTWTWVSHVECYAGEATSVASRNGKGVGCYPYRPDHVAAVLRPGSIGVSPAVFDFPKAMAYFDSASKDKYGWRTLLTFLLLNKNPVEGEQICSEFADNWYAAGGLPLFADIWPAYRTAPATLLTSRGFSLVWQDQQLFEDVL